MSVLYVTDQGAYLIKKGKRLFVTKKGKILHQIHTFNLDQVVLMGSISISAGAIAFLIPTLCTYLFRLPLLPHEEAIP